MLLPQLDEHELPPVIPPVSATVQVYTVPPAVLLRAMPGLLPLHIAVLDGVALTEGVGLTVTTAVADAEQVVPAVPIIV